MLPPSHLDFPKKRVPGHGRWSGLLALLAGNAVTIAGVLAFGWDLMSVLFLMLLEVCASAVGLLRAVVLHQHIVADPAHQQEQFTGWLRIRHAHSPVFADGLAYRTLPYPAVFLILITLALANQASGPLTAGIPLALSALAVAGLAYAETATLRRDVAAVPFGLLRTRAIAMIYRTAGVTVLFFAGLVWLWGVERPLQEVIVLALLGKTVMEAWLLR